MEISEQLLCLFSGHPKERDGSYVVEVPEQELQLGEIKDGETYRIALLSGRTNSTLDREEPKRDSTPEGGVPSPPVQEGDIREVEIEDIGEQGDGIARVERGFVVIVPDTKLGERVTIDIVNVRQKVAFAEVVERQSPIS